jgi:4-hydroxy-tetrahydrodipicolinate synthase
MTRDDIRAALTGPLDTIRTPFNRDGSIDYGAMRGMIDFMIDAGCRTTMLTAGNSHFHCMSEGEITDMATIAAEHTDGRALVVAADYCFDTRRAVEFARRCAGIGVDVLMVRPPEWDTTSTTADSLVAHYDAIGQHIPVMLVTNVFASRSEQQSLDAIKAIRDRVENVVAVKEDLGGAFAQNMSAIVHEKWAVFSGGGFRAHLNMLAFGCDGFMSPFMNFQPRIAHDYWAAVSAGDIAQALRIFRDVEAPLEQHMRTYSGGRDAALHGLFELRGLAGRWRREPYHSLTDDEMTQLKAFAQRLGIV